MNRKLQHIVCIIILTVSVWGIYHIINWQPTSGDNNIIKQDIETSIKSILSDARTELSNQKSKVRNILAEKSPLNNYTLKSNLFKEAVFFITKEDSLVYWSANIIHPDSINYQNNESFFTTATLSGIHLKTTLDSISIHMLVPILYQYPINNSQLQDHYNTKLKVPSGVILTPIKQDIENANLILLNKTPTLEISIKEQDYPKSNVLYLLLLFLGATCLLLYLALSIATQLKNTIAIVIAAIVFIAVNGSLFYFFNSLAASSLLNTTELFSPSIFASSQTFASLGHFFLFSIQMLAIAYFFFRLKITLFSHNYIPHIIQTILIAVLLFEVSQNTINLINNSTFSLLIYKLVSLPYYALIAFISVMIQFGAFYLIMHKSYAYLRVDTIPKTVMIIRLLGVAICYLLFYQSAGLTIVVPIFLLFFFTLYDWQIKRDRPSTGLNPLQWILITVFSLFLSYIILDSSKIKLEEEDALIASNLSNNIINEHDFKTESALPGIEQKLNEDTQLHRMISDPSFPLNNIEDYLFDNQFNSLKESYDIQFIICWPDAILNIEENDSVTNCYSYFEELFLTHGQPIKQSNFYFMDNKNGRISYFGKITVNSKNYDEITLFIDLESKVSSAGRGYPEVLQSSEEITSDIPENYSSARYINHKLITSKGSFNYSPLDKWLDEDHKQGNIKCQSDNYVHFAIRHNNSVVVVSRPEETAFAYLLLFSYLFLLTYLFIQVVFSSKNLFSKRIRPNTIEKKLKVSFAALLILSFLILSIFALYFTYDQQTTQQQTNLKGQLEIIHTGLEQYGGNSSSLEEISEEFMLDMYLNDLSNMFKCDINIYTIEGELFATSRPEIFDLSLVSTLINPNALFPLRSGNKKVVIENEKIGTLNYSSLYMLLTNDMNTPIGIVNVPFFVSSQNLARILSNYLVIAINLFIVFLVLTIIFSNALGRRLVQPIKNIQQKMGQIKLGQQNEKIAYKGEDELKELVEQYNILVDELEKSVQLLAQSERETAWRKMARQIAHEIKNPLTPMRLSIQQLQRLSKDDPEHFENMFSKTATSLIEQIDSLSDIASSFSNFAKTPKSSFEPIEINNRLEMILMAFQNMQNISIELEKCSTTLLVSADKNQFTQLINNLLKNSIQAIPKGEKGMIRIKVSYQTEKAIIELSDNGKGVPGEIKDKLFEPNFTTKTSGMGLGLAISKNIVAGMDGTISFDSEPTKGTTFTIELPTI